MGVWRRTIMAGALALGAGAAPAALPPDQPIGEPLARETADALALRPLAFALRGVSEAASVGPAPQVRAAPRGRGALSGAEVAVLGFGVLCTAAGAGMLGAAAAGGLRPRRS